IVRAGQTELFHDFQSWLEYSIETATDLRKLIGEPGEEGNSAKGDDAQVELPTKLIRFGIGYPAQDGIAMHLGKQHDEASADDGQQDSKAPIDEGVGIKGVGVPSDECENEGGCDKDHEVANVDEHGPDE